MSKENKVKENVLMMVDDRSAKENQGSVGEFMTW